MPLPPDWRTRWIELVVQGRGDPNFLSGGPILDAAGGLSVYQQAWRLRHAEALRIECPGLSALAGDRFSALATSYFAANPSQSWTLDRVADRFADWLAAAGEAASFVEMARLDQRVMRSFSGGELPRIRPEDLPHGLPRVALQPHASVLRNTTDVHRFRTALITGIPLPAVAPGDAWLVIWRADLTVQTLEVDSATWAILSGLEAGLAVDESLEQAFSLGFLPPDTLDVQVAETFRLGTEHGILGLRP